MNWKEFIASIVTSTAWPLAAVFAIWTFRNRIEDLIAKVAKLKYKDLEVDFAKVRENAENIKRYKINEHLPPQSGTTQNLSDEIEGMIELAPSYAVILSWSFLEISISETIERIFGPKETDRRINSLRKIDLLNSIDGVDSTIIELLNELRVMRNKITHNLVAAKAIDSADARIYADAAFDIDIYLRNLNNQG